MLKDITMKDSQVNIFNGRNAECAKTNGFTDDGEVAHDRCILAIKK